MRIKYETTTDGSVTFLANPNEKLKSATIVFKEQPLVRDHCYYVHITRGNGKEVSEYFKTLATAKKFIGFFYR